MRNGLLAVLAIPPLAVAYYFAVALPANERARLQFEKEKYEAAQKEKLAEESKRQKELEDQQALLDSCIGDAELTYWRYIKLNGNAVPNKPGTYTATVQVWNTADKRKNDELAECHRRFK